MNVREATLEDYQAIMAVRRRNGLSQRSFEEWKHNWANNPFRTPGVHLPIGWVLEDDNKQVVGTFANIPVGYQFNGRRLLAAAASSWAVDPKWRHASLLLVTRYLQQSNVDLLLNASANLEAGRVFAAFEAQRVPHRAYNEVLLWITHYSQLVASALRRRGYSATGGLNYPAALALWGLDALKRRNRFGRASGAVRRLDDFDERFDVFWSRLRQRPDRLLAVRSRAALAWHFKFALRRGEAAILVLEAGGGLAGYLVMVRKDRADIGLRRFQVADLQVLDQVPEHVEVLMAAALRLARKQGVHVVEVVGHESFKRRVLEQLAPRRRKLPTWPFFYKAMRPELRPALAPAEAWDPSPLDGDASL